MKLDIVRAWKDESYRSSLSTQEQAMLPENPAGALEVSDAELEAIHGAGGGGGDFDVNSMHFCPHTFSQQDENALIPVGISVALLGNSSAAGQTETQLCQ